MSILKKAYEITTWDDVWDAEQQKFIEKRKSLIGSDQMTSQNRALSPKLTRNVNGTKKLTFKMYRYYIDSYDGEKKENPFISELVSERKVKLHYKDKWYDFIVKNISENSSDYSYTYQLEDALVQELSKNGFGVTLDEKIKEPKNIGTAKELAESVLRDTDWVVESEAFVQKVEEALVYIRIPAGTKVRKILDQTLLTAGVSDIEHEINVETIALAFYSSCTGRPHRFQFIVLPSYEKEDVKINDKRIIEMANCQYYYEVNEPEEYIESSFMSLMYLPKGWTILDKGLDGVGDDYDTTVSYWYRGNRYGFAQQAEFIPLLDKYCQLYECEEEEYYGYQDVQYMSPVFVQDVITNAEFKGTSGWVGTFIQLDKETKKDAAAKVSDVYGYFDNSGNFVSATSDMLGGVDIDLDRYTSYLKIEVPGGESQPLVLNTGFWDKRVTTATVSPGEKWVFRTKILDSEGEVIVDTNTGDGLGSNPAMLFKLAEIKYDPNSEGYIINNTERCQASNVTKANDTYGEYCFTFIHTEPISEEDFRKKEIKLIIGLPAEEATYYIEKMELFRAEEHTIINEAGEEVTKFFAPGEIDEDGIIQNKFKLFKAEELEDITDIKQISFETVDAIDYSTYKPVYNEGAQKVRAVSAKESNYFNILQSIAETFECWMSLEITRAEANEDNWQEGAIKSKKVCFKNYAGNDNHASFQYGVNLKDIQRTFASKNIVSKLIVKQNNNQYAPNGFCTIARADSNPTGENYIYDFQYYFNKGLLNADDYYSLVYIPSTVENDSTLQGYYPRIKEINNRLKPINETIVNKQLELIKLQADKEIQEGLMSAAEDGIEETANEFLQLFGVSIQQINKFNTETIVPNISISDEQADIYGVTLWGQPDSYTRNSKIEYDIYRKDWGEDSIIEADIDWHNSKAMPDSQITEDGYQIKWTATENTHCGLRVAKKDSGGNIVDFKPGHQYKLTYTLTIPAGIAKKIVTINGHMHSFKDIRTSVTIGDKTNRIWGPAYNYAQPAQEVSTEAVPIDVEVVGTYFFNPGDKELKTNYLYIQPNKGTKIGADYTISNIQLYELSEPTIVNYNIDIVGVEIPALSTQVKGYSLESYTLEGIDENNQKVISLVEEYLEYKRQYNQSLEKLGATSEEEAATDETASGLYSSIKILNNELQELQEESARLLEEKAFLNKLFFSRYSRFIQEGTWLKEDYTDDEKYFIDAQSVMYNSCYPQVQYTINVLELSMLPGYEMFTFELGDKTHVVDPQFFGNDLQEEIVITELVEELDDPTKNSIKVQNFKNQFQDLFQKITASVQQTQYNTGSYEKAVALAEADAKSKGQFLNEALASGMDKLSVAGQTTVEQGANGITLTDSNTQDQMRLIGGAIMMSRQDENGVRKWSTGLTPEGISASLVTAGTLNAANIAIMNVDEPVFRWDAFGLTAFDAEWTSQGVISKTDYTKFVRFDKCGIYGMSGKDGRTWKPLGPNPSATVMNDATFALTWEGLKVTGNEGVIARIGKQDEHIVYITDGNGQPIFQVNNDGTSEIAGWTISGKTGYNGGFYHDVRVDGGENPTHRVGLKIEDGKDNRYAFYVKKFTPNQQSWDKPNGDLVFGVKYDGSMVATQGRVGNWTLGTIEDQVSGLYYSDEKAKSGLAVNPDYQTDPIFWAGYTGYGATPWEHNNQPGFNVNEHKSWDELTKFYIDGTGKVVCQDIKASGGSIGPLTISPNRIGAFSEFTRDHSRDFTTPALRPYQIIRDKNDSTKFGFVIREYESLGQTPCFSEYDTFAPAEFVVRSMNTIIGSGSVLTITLQILACIQYEVSLKMVGIWPVRKGIYSAEFTKLFTCQGDDPREGTFDVRLEEGEEYYICLFFTQCPDDWLDSDYNPPTKLTEDMQDQLIIKWETTYDSVSITKDGVGGFFKTKKVNYVGDCKQLYINELGQLCVLET